MRIKLAIRISHHTQILCVWLLVRRLELYFLCLFCLLTSQLSFCAYPCVCLPESGNLEKAVLVCAYLEVVAAKALSRLPPRRCLQAFILVRISNKIPASWPWKTDITRAKAVPSSFSLFLSTEWFELSRCSLILPSSVRMIFIYKAKQKRFPRNRDQFSFSA